jgi:radical SAM superfamily enzyme YgiQ (UPF0313 family)
VDDTGGGIQYKSMPCHFKKNMRRHRYSAHMNFGLARLYSYLSNLRLNVEVDDFVLRASKDVKGRSALEKIKNYLHHPQRHIFEINKAIETIINLLRIEKFDLIGVSLTNDYAAHITLLLLKLIKIKFPRIKTIVGGAHVNIVNNDLLKTNFIDYVIKGPGEPVLKEMLKYKDPDEINMSNISKIVYERGGKAVCVSKYNFSIDETAVPNYDNLIPNTNNYAIPYMLSQGCRNRCNFCVEPRMLRLEFLNLNKATEDIIFLINKYQNNYIIFNDSDMLANKEFLENFCDRIIKKRIKIKWSCLMCLRKVNAALFRKLYSAGCRFISWGLETGSKNSLNYINKKIDLDICPEILKLSSRAGIRNIILLMTNMFWESSKDLQETIALLEVIKSDISLIGISRFWLSKSSNFYVKSNKYNIFPMDEDPYLAKTDFLCEWNKEHKSHEDILKKFIRKSRIPIINSL